jgi:hypothetical protein
VSESLRERERLLADGGDEKRRDETDGGREVVGGRMGAADGEGVE